MTAPQSKIDKWFMRGKDILILLGAVWASLIFLNGYYNLPLATAANAEEIEAVKKRVNEIEMRLVRIESKQDYQIQSLDELKSWVRGDH